MHKHLKFAWLFVPTIMFTASLIVTRILYSGSFLFIFLGWNIFLAIVPVFICQFLRDQNITRVKKCFLFGLWLLFFPNALYIITDLVHLIERPPVPLWFDMMLLFSAAANGLLAAYISLVQVEEFLLKQFRALHARMIICICMIAGSFGVYLGRFLRWNSWDIVTDPFGLLGEVMRSIFYPGYRFQAWAITLLFSVFFITFYFAIKSFGRRYKQV